MACLFNDNINDYLVTNPIKYKVFSYKSFTFQPMSNHISNLCLIIYSLILK